MKTRHDGDCTIYSSLSNRMPEDGICTCGYGHQLKGEADRSEMYSEELKEKFREKVKNLEGDCESLEKENAEILKKLEDKFCVKEGD